MRAIYNDCTDPYFNLAAEQFLIEGYTASEDVFMLWRNSPSIIIGKNQNTWAEINEEYVRENGIKVARRLTGGGAVYHDLGNINFSFVTSHSGSSRLNFERFGLPVIGALHKMGIDAVLDGRNDITAYGYKISGNAQCVTNSKSGVRTVLHHGTLLFDADLGALSRALRVSEKKISAKGVKSVRSRVKNISEFECYRGERSAEGFMAAMFGELSGRAPEKFTPSEISEIEKIRDGKFALWEWNYGASPVFGIKKEKRFPIGTLSADIECENGKICEIKIFGDFFGNTDKSELENLLCGVKYERSVVKRVLSENSGMVCDVIFGADAEDVASLLFDD